MSEDEGNRSRTPTFAGPRPTLRSAAGSPSTGRRSRCLRRVRTARGVPRAAEAFERDRSLRPRDARDHPATLVDRRRGPVRGRAAADEGDPAGAWALLKAVVRASRDMERAVPGPVPEHRDHPGPVRPRAGRRRGPRTLSQRRAPGGRSTTWPRPRHSRRPFRSSTARNIRTPKSRSRDLEPLIVERARRRADAGAFDPFAFAPNLGAFLRGEPERSRRVLRLLAANDLAWCDRPASERPAFAVPRLRIYEADPAAPPAREPSRPRSWPAGPTHP